MLAPLRIALILSTLPLATSCATQHLTAEQKAEALLTDQQKSWKAAHDTFLASSTKKSTNFVNEDAMKFITPENSSIRIGLKDQRALLLKDGHDIAMNFRVSTGRSSHPTPSGDFQIIEKDRHHASSKYGTFVSAEGESLGGEVNTSVDTKPEGASYVGAPMPYFCRLTNDGVGLHIGNVPNYPASHGCIRVQRAVMPKIWNVVKRGTPVTITNYSVEKPVETTPPSDAAPAKKPSAPSSVGKHNPHQPPTPKNLQKADILTARPNLIPQHHKPEEAAPLVFLLRHRPPR